jgi:hypothetical protein
MGIGVRDMEDESIKLFFSYSHKDEVFREDLANHLRILTREGVITSWYDRKIRAGDEWDHQIHAQLKTADIILLLISADFFASDYCMDIEVTTALQRHADEEARVIPVIVRATDWKRAPFGKLQALPTHGKPITSWSNRDEAFLDVAQGIREVAETLRTQRKQKLEAKQNAQEQYKQKVEEILSSQGRISRIARDTLTELREDLGLTPEEAQNIETHAFKPYHEYEDKLKRYEQTLRKVMLQYPFSEEIKKDLQYRQRDLGIKPEDGERLEQRMLAEAEALQQEKVPEIKSEAQRQQEAERVRQHELQAQHDQEELRPAQGEAQDQQETEKAGLGGTQMVQIGETHFPEGHEEAKKFRESKKARRAIRVPVTFAVPFERQVEVGVSLKMIDVGNGICRLLVKAEDICLTGFNLCFETWEDSKVYKATATWIAVGE